MIFSKRCKNCTFFRVLDLANPRGQINRMDCNGNFCENVAKRETGRNERDEKIGDFAFAQKFGAEKMS